MAKNQHSGVSMAAAFLACLSAFSFPSVILEDVPRWPWVDNCCLGDLLCLL